MSRPKPTTSSEGTTTTHDPTSRALRLLFFYVVAVSFGVLGLRRVMQNAIQVLNGSSIEISISYTAVFVVTFFVTFLTIYDIYLLSSDKLSIYPWPGGCRTLLTTAMGLTISGSILGLFAGMGWNAWSKPFLGTFLAAFGIRVVLLSLVIVDGIRKNLRILIDAAGPEPLEQSRARKP